MEDYKKKYEDALENLKKIRNANKDNKELVDFIEYKYPELKEREEESIKEDIISLVNEFWERIGSINPEYSSRSKMIAWLEKQGEQKCFDVLNEEDYNEIETIAMHLENMNNEAMAVSLREILYKYKCKPSTWSEEDYNEMGVIACHLDNMGNEAMANSLLCIRDKYNNVKPRHKYEWSEEDEKNYNTILKIIQNFDTSAQSANKLSNWLKSLKERYTWKPSDEQMEALSNALGLAKSCGEESFYDLRALYEQLKKLREE
jgi:hypothetical protein